MKKLFSLVTLLLFAHLLFAKEIDEATAKLVAQNFLLTQTSFRTTGQRLVLQPVSLSFARSQRTSTEGKATALNYYYVFNVNAKGYIIVSGDDAATPILGYSDQRAFPTRELPENVAKWLEGYKRQIRDIIANHLSASEAIKKEWTTLKLAGGQRQGATKKEAAVNPLMQTQWNQSPYFNALCPGGSVTGCVATAMAQVMKYWNYPATGSGFHSYNHHAYGTLSANFGSTTYQWNAMPNVLNSANNAVATLMYQVGVSVDMNYSPESSGAYVITSQSPVTNCAEYALRTYFGYKNTLQGLERRNYTDQQWTALLKAELDASRPILYAGFGNGGGHCFVADGYNNNSYFHFNWGWGGYYDGYFQINALNPTGVGTGGGSGGYNSGQQAVVGIEPPAAAPQVSGISLFDYVTPSATTLYYGQAFSISTNLVNTGNGTFNGDYMAAIFDNAKNLIDSVQVLGGYSLPGGHHYLNNLVFSTNGKLNMLPGAYYIGIFYRNSGGNWQQAANNGAYTNLVQITVVNQNEISLYAPMTVSPNTKLTRGQPASVNLNIVNEGATTFKGQYDVSLYNLDGSFAQTIGTINEDDGLPSGYTYLAPYLTFSSPAITVAPGTYLLAAQHNPDNSGWQLTGSSYYQNPIKVTVVEASLQPDVYEQNNEVGQAYTLAANFNGNDAVVTTAGSNCHVVTDNDFYKIDLPAGYNYQVAPRLYDSYAGGNGNTYTLDALFSYSTDGVNWSESFDDVLPASVPASGGGQLYFRVAPYFAGETGTYLLEIKLTKVPAVFEWTGAVSTDWSTAANWSMGRVPNANDDITIPAGTPYSPTVKNGVCRTVTVAPGAKLTVASGGNLTVNKK